MTSGAYDVVVVGSGSSGGALAARLSEDPDRNVLVLEAGTVYESVSAMPATLRDPSDVSGGMVGSPHNWDLVGEFTDGFRAPVARGLGLGGSSSINAAYFIRGTRHDFGRWAALGNDEWSYEKVLPHFRRSESERDFAADARHHGTSGPIPVQREAIDRAPRFTQAFTEAALALGHPFEADKNAEGVGGVGPVPTNIAGATRVGTAIGYLIPSLGRTNLTVRGGVRVMRILLDGTRCVGVEARVDGRIERIPAAEVVLAAGALRTPQLLMLSGIGPAAHLRDRGVDVLVDLPGVGQNLTDHPKMSTPWTYDGTFPEAPGRNVMTSNLNWTSRDGGRPGDLEILPFVATRASMLKLPSGPETRFPVVQVSVLQEDSRGEVRLASADPGDPPRLSWNFFRAGHDRARIREAMTMLHDLFAAPPMRRIGARLLSLDARDLAGPDASFAWMRSHLNYAGHPSCTCRMGVESDPLAVVDQTGRVRGVQNLRVCDQSIFPEITSRGPAATAIMLGERVSSLIS